MLLTLKWVLTSTTEVLITVHSLKTICSLFLKIVSKRGSDAVCSDSAFFFIKLSDGSKLELS